MDAKVGDHVITPRIGKPVEINALWFAALQDGRAVSPSTARPIRSRTTMRRRACARRSSASGTRERGCCFDVLDGPDGDDPAIRPNQLFAVALAPELLTPERARAVVDVCVRELWTPVGLRTLAPGDPAYVGHYGGDQTARDGAYHQGTVWPWLLGAFVQAHLNVYGDPALARTFIAPLADALDGYGVGTLGEIFDGDAPHAPCGTIAQAWSVAELIAALRLRRLIQARLRRLASASLRLASRARSFAMSSTSAAFGAADRRWLARAWSFRRCHRATRRPGSACLA